MGFFNSSQQAMYNLSLSLSLSPMYLQGILLFIDFNKEKIQYKRLSEKIKYGIE